jgi:hypothetical protein
VRKHANNKRDADRERGRKLREIIGGIFATIVWFFIDFAFVWPESHERAYWAAIIFVAAQLIQIIQIPWRITVKILVGWFVIAPLGYFFLPATPKPETETHHWLTAANDPTPPNDCGQLPESATLVMFGSNVVWNIGSESNRTALRVGGCTALEIERGALGLSITGDVFAPDGKIAGRITHNEVHLAQGEIFYADKSGDGSALTVYGSAKGEEIFYVRYINPSAIDIRGNFYCADDKVSLAINPNHTVTAKSPHITCDMGNNCVQGATLVFDGIHCSIGKH